MGSMHGDTLGSVRLEGAALARAIKGWGRALGFQHVGIAQAHLEEAEARLLEWLAHGYHGDMDYMARHGVKRSRPAALVPGTVSVISARMNYLPPGARESESVLGDSLRAFVSRYALGRDYHKVVRHRLVRLARLIARHVAGFAWRAFADSAPVMEVELAVQAGVGWRGKHTLLLARDAGSWFFLGELYTNLPLPPDPPEPDHCGTCTRCLDACPTQAIIAPYRIDARRCISYLTIEHKGEIPEALRPLMGNRIYGCDDCQLVCPWTRFAQTSGEPDFAVRNGLDDVSLVALFHWSEAEFLERFAGSPIRRLGYERWLRNIAVALGNAATTPEVVAALEARRDHPSALVRTHVAWALARHRRQRSAA